MGVMAASWAARGLALLERYAEASDGVDLDLAIDALKQALHGEPEHTDAGLWLYHLALAHGQRADVQPDAALALADYTRAIDLGELIYHELEPEDPDRDLAVLLLADCHWDRSWRRRYGTGMDEADADRDLDDLSAVLSSLAPTGHNPTVARYLDLLRGMAMVERCAYGLDPGERGRLDAGIALLVPALSWLTDAPVGDWFAQSRIAVAYGLLSDAYQQRTILDECVADLDLAVEAAEAAIVRMEPDSAPAPLLYRYLAEAHQMRWIARTEVTGDGDSGGLPEGARRDLDAAIDAWRVVLGVDIDAWSASNCGDLLRERADLTGDPDDARAAMTLLRAAIAQPGTGDVWEVRRSLADTGESLARLTGDHKWLIAATADLDAALRDPTVPDDDRLRMWLTRVNQENELAKHERRGVDTAAAYRGVVDQAIRNLERSVAVDPDLWAGASTQLGLATIAVAGYDGCYDADQARRLLTPGTAGGQDGPLWAFAQAGLGVVQHLEEIHHPTADGDGGTGHVARALRSGALGDQDGAMRAMAGLMRHLRSAYTGDRRATLNDRRAPAVPATGPAPVGAGTMDEELMSAFNEILAVGLDFDAARMRALAERIGPLLDGVPESSYYFATAQFLRTALAVADPLAVPPVTLPPLPSASGEFANLELAHQFTRVALLLTQGTSRDDRDAIRDAARHVEELLAMLPPTETRMVQGATMLAGHAWLELARRTVPPGPVAARAEEHLHRALRMLGGHQVPIWANIAIGCAEASRLSGEPARRGRELGLSALRGYAWQALAQGGAENAVAAARNAAAAARTVTGWCLTDLDAEPGVDSELIAALEAGRGLMLGAVTGSRRIADRLAERGLTELLEEWRATEGHGRDLLTGERLGDPAGMLELPDELRLRVLRALGTDEVVGFDTVTPTGIRVALAELGADALVYLLPGTDGGGVDPAGAAVVVPAIGDVVVLRLPRLRDAPESAIARYVRAHARARDLEPEVPQRPGGRLDELCEWAWHAAMGDVLARVRGARPGARPRLVLVPTGALGLVPWHAARIRDGGGWRYAVAEAVFSYAPSARLLCAGAGHRPVGIRSALIVGDPGGDLSSAGIEARSIHREFYPDGTYFGQPAEVARRAGTPGDVLDWIDAAAPGPSLLHFACHGAIDPRNPTDAHLVLAGGARLSAGALLERSRSVALQIEQVFLAACTTGVTADIHDEALSLATAFLAAGARTVFGSLWRVPDEDTSVLMFMVHQFLRVDGCQPVDALHRAQLWMLDAGRPLPDGMPESLRRRCDRGRVFEPVSWAGFTHLGR